MDIDARAFGQLEGKVEALQTMMSAQNITLGTLTVQLDLVQKTLAEARGGWRTLVWLGGLTATLSASVTWGVQHLIK
jgi:hypothetical protein